MLAMSFAEGTGEGMRSSCHGLKRVAALLDDERRQAEPTVKLADAGVGIGGDGKLGERVAAMRVPAGREDQSLSAMSLGCVTEPGVGGDEGCVIGSGRFTLAPSPGPVPVSSA